MNEDTKLNEALAEAVAILETMKPKPPRPTRKQLKKALVAADKRIAELQAEAKREHGLISGLRKQLETAMPLGEHDREVTALEQRIAEFRAANEEALALVCKQRAKIKAMEPTGPNYPQKLWDVVSGFRSEPQNCYYRITRRYSDWHALLNVTGYCAPTLEELVDKLHEAQRAEAMEAQPE